MIAYDRRGFGRSSQPTIGYDYDTFAADLKALLDHLALGEDICCAGSRWARRGDPLPRHLRAPPVSARRSCSARSPRTCSRPPTTPRGWTGRSSTASGGRPRGPLPWFDEFFDNFYNIDELAPERIGDAALKCDFQVAAGSSWYASYACVDTWLTDFRADVAKIDIPTLVVHGTKDRILPFPNTAGRLEALNSNIRVVPVENGPHNVGWTFPEECNKALLDFLG